MEVTWPNDEMTRLLARNSSTQRLGVQCNGLCFGHARILFFQGECVWFMIVEEGREQEAVEGCRGSRGSLSILVG